jgi:hypothetical protein
MTDNRVKVTGYQLREALRRWRDQEQICANNFKTSVFQFEGDNKGNPKDWAIQFERAYHAVAMIEAAQQAYNEQLVVNVNGKNMSLALAIKLVNGAGRMAKMWRDAAISDGNDRHSYMSNRRNKDEEMSARQVPQDAAVKLTNEAASFAGALRSAIAEVNSKEVTLDMKGFDPTVLA